jgi:hypothetical protein
VYRLTVARCGDVLFEVQTESVCRRDTLLELFGCKFPADEGFSVAVAEVAFRTIGGW